MVQWVDAMQSSHTSECTYSGCRVMWLYGGEDSQTLDGLGV
jgi:hypothetical protein